MLKCSTLFRKTPSILSFQSVFMDPALPETSLARISNDRCVTTSNDWSSALILSDLIQAFSNESDPSLPFSGNIFFICSGTCSFLVFLYPLAAPSHYPELVSPHLLTTPPECPRLSLALHIPCRLIVLFCFDNHLHTNSLQVSILGPQVSAELQTQTPRC